MSLRLLYAANVRIPGPRAHSIQTERSCAAFAEAGAGIELWVPQRRGVPSAVPEAPYPIRRLACIDCIDLLPARLQRPAFLLQSWSFSRAVTRRLESHRAFDLLYLREPYGLAWIEGAPKAYEAHGLPRRRRSWRRLRRALRGVEAVIALNPYLAERYRELGVEPRRVSVVPAAASGEPSGIEQGAARRELGIAADRRVACYAGTLSTAKGVETLLAAARELPEPWMVLLVGGDHHQQAWARRGMARLAISEERVRLDPGVAPSRVPGYLAAADVLVAPNSARDPSSSLWTSPLKLFEYDQAARPIVLSDVGALRAAAAELSDAAPLTWFRPDDPIALVDALIRAFGRPVASGAIPDGGGWRRRAVRILDHLVAVKDSP